MQDERTKTMQTNAEWEEPENTPRIGGREAEKRGGKRWKLKARRKEKGGEGSEVKDREVNGLLYYYRVATTSGPLRHMTAPTTTEPLHHTFLTW